MYFEEYIKITVENVAIELREILLYQLSEDFNSAIMLRAFGFFRNWEHQTDFGNICEQNSCVTAGSNRLVRPFESFYLLKFKKTCCMNLMIQLIGILFFKLAGQLDQY